MQRPPTILIVNNDPAAVEIFRQQLAPYPYTLKVARDGEEALEAIRSDPPDLVLTDLRLPKISGFELCRRVRRDKDTRFIPVIAFSDFNDAKDKLKAVELGANDFFVQPVNPVELTTRIKSLLSTKLMHDDLDTSESILFSLAGALEAKDTSTHGHSERVADIAEKIARHMGLRDDRVRAIKKGGLLHDIGKIGVKESVLLKAEKLTDDEMEHIRTHSLRGFEICQPLKSLERCLPIIRSHHERIDGKGYPDGIAGDSIPIEARITAVADAMDAMTADRPYRKGMSNDKALKIFKKEMDSGQWDPACVRSLIEVMEK